MPKRCLPGVWEPPIPTKFITKAINKRGVDPRRNFFFFEESYFFLYYIR